MLTSGDFESKQIIFVFTNQEEKLSFQNDNLVVRSEDGKIKLQCTCYRIFAIFLIGYGTITSGLIQRAKKFGFSIIMMNQNLKIYEHIGNRLEGNTLLRKAQYDYDSLELAKHITENKIQNQCRQLSNVRIKSELQKEAIINLKKYSELVKCSNNLTEIMGYEGMASKAYFSNYFNNILWRRREPRTKCDMINSVLDIGYTILFSFIEALLDCYGFDIYCGVMHRNFYMRKSLVCDIMEPFRVLIDSQIKKAINLHQCKEEDFTVENGQYRLKWEKNPEYISWLIKPIMDHKKEIHLYIQNYYRAFSKHKSIEDFPNFILGGEKNDNCELRYIR